MSDQFVISVIREDPSKISNVVCYLKCKNCDASYIGKSNRICCQSMNEHNGGDPESHVYLHQINEKHEIDFDNIKILDRASNDDKLVWKEMLYIRKYNPSLNAQKESQLFTLIIRNTKQEDKRKKQSSITKNSENLV